MGDSCGRKGDRLTIRTIKDTIALCWSETNLPMQDARDGVVCSSSPACLARLALRRLGVRPAMAILSWADRLTKDVEDGVRETKAGGVQVEEAQGRSTPCAVVVCGRRPFEIHVVRDLWHGLAFFWRTNIALTGWVAFKIAVHLRRRADLARTGLCQRICLS